jgi:hypothetical protein
VSYCGQTYGLCKKKIASTLDPLVLQNRLKPAKALKYLGNSVPSFEDKLDQVTG